jgi:polysaccharide biosynthesis protein PslG
MWIRLLPSPCAAIRLLAAALTLAMVVLIPTATASRAGGGSPYGIAAGGNLNKLARKNLARELDVYRVAGSRWIRIDVNWEVIQARGPSRYNWAPFDRVVRAAAKRGLQVLAAIVYTPAWARPGTHDGTYPPADLGRFGAFCKAAVVHYSPMGVHYWEIWNEPNRGFWKPSPDPARYTQMLRLAYDTIKRADSQSFVVSGGLSPYGALGQAGADGMNPVTFLEKMYDGGAAGYFDALGWHPYEWSVGLRFHPASAWSQLVETSTSARSIMVAHGDGAKRIWGTEYGAPTGDFSGGMSEAGQANLLRAAYEKWTGWTWTGPLFWYSARDAGTNPVDREHHFGLVRRDFSQKSSFSAFQNAARNG